MFTITVRMSGESGKVDLLLTKESAGIRWTDLGKGLHGNNSLKLHKDRGIEHNYTVNSQLSVLGLYNFVRFLLASKQKIL